MNAGRLLLNAVELCKGVSTLNVASPQSRRECLASIIFAAISTEAFINELGRLAAANVSSGPGWVGGLAEILGDAEKVRTSLESKYNLAKFIVTGQVFDRGTLPFQDFALLVDVRNLIVHTKAEEVIVRKKPDGGLAWETRVMARLQERGAVTTSGFPSQLVPREEGLFLSDLLEEISTQSVARWSCGAASGIVNGVLDAMASNTRFAGRVKRIYSEDFQKPKF